MMRELKVCTAVLLAALIGLAGSPALAHKGSDAYLDVQQAASGELSFTYSVAIKDLDLLLPVDANADGKVTWGELKVAMPSILSLLNTAASIESTDGKAGKAVSTPVASAAPSPAGALSCGLNWQPGGIEQRGDGNYVRLVAQARCPADMPLAIRYTLFRDQDATHRLLLAGRIGGREFLTTSSPQQVTPVLLSTASNASAASANGASNGAALPSAGRWSTLRDYFSLGVQHLLEGYDHLAFLLALLIPLRLRIGRGTPLHDGVHSAVQGQTPAGSVWIALLRAVTAFTIGHSITLMMATLGWTNASVNWVEPAIALSIGVTAWLNLRPVAWIRTDVLALVFGMVHGVGFAGLLREASAPSGLLPWALAGFNLGVEAGQLIAVAGWVILSQPLLNRSWYRTGVIRGGSVLLILLSAWWFWLRVR